MALLRIAFLSVALAASAAAVEIRFVPATAEGVVSLGIYGASGKLVRLLCDEWPIANFTAGLNGLSTEWDGNDSAGRPVPAGTYRARGFVIGNVGVEGEAFHFNDWIASGDAPRIVSVLATALLPGGEWLLAARLADGNVSLLRYSPAEPNPWRTLATGKPQDAAGKIKVTSAAGRAFMLMDKKIRALDLASGLEIPVPPAFAGAFDISARDDSLLVLTENNLRVFGVSDLLERQIFPLPGVGAAGAALLSGDAAVVLAGDGSLWHGGPTWNQIELPDGSKAIALTAGRAGTFWILEQKDDRPAVAVQYSPQEGRLAEWIPSSNDVAAGLSASVEEDYFCAIFRGSSGERTVAIRRGTGGTWQFVADKTITACGSFGWTGEKLSPLSGEIPSEVNLALAENPLDAAAPRSLTVRAAEFSGGTGLLTADGLPLVRVAEGGGFARLMVLPGSGTNTAQFYQGDGACVEQYKLTNLGDITAFDAGTIEMEGGAEKPAPPEEEVPDPTP